MDWLLFLPQLPSNPSSLRVTVWRKMRAAGALGLQNGVWVLPDLPEQQKFTSELLLSLQNQGATGQIFKVSPLTNDIEKEIFARFRADREEEYTELIEKSSALLEEITEEISVEKYTFAELEETEQEMQKLEKWLEKIQKRDFTVAKNAEESVQIMHQCQNALREYSKQVYIKQGMEAETDIDYLDQ